MLEVAELDTPPQSQIPDTHHHFQSATYRKLTIMHFYEPFRRARFLSDPDPDSRAFVDFPPGHPNLKGYSNINERIFFEADKPMLIDHTLLDDKSGIYYPFPAGSLTSIYHPLRLYIKFAHPESFEKLQQNTKALGSEAPYRIMGDLNLHRILPLAEPRTKRRSIRWGREFFYEDFKFYPKVIWFPETAADDETMQIAFEEGYEGVVLRDTQMAKKDGQEKPYFNPLYYQVKDKKGGEKYLTIIHFSSDLSGPYSFEPSETENGDRHLIKAKAHAVPSKNGTKLVTIATDGELYGHHQEFRDKFAHFILSPQALKKHGYEPQQVCQLIGSPQGEYEITRIISPSSWSCEHGVGRWDGQCWEGVEDLEDKETKIAMHQESNALEQQIYTALDSTIPDWEDRFLEPVLETRMSMYFNGDIYDDLKQIANRQGFGFLNTQRGFNLFLSWYSLENASQSCRAFFPGKNGIERKLGWQNLNEARLLLERAYKA